MDPNVLSIVESIAQLERSVDRSFKSRASSSRDDVVSAEARLLVILRGMHGYMNTFSPIHCLPPEMLASIFKEVVASCVKLPISAYGHSDDKADIRPQFRLAHVCQVWRGVALNDASLWAHVDVGYPDEAVKFFLRQSSGYPLTLYASTEKASLVDEILQDHGTRIRTIYATSSQEDVVATRASYYPPNYPYAPRGGRPLPPLPRVLNNPLSGNSRDVKELSCPIFTHFCSSVPQLECLMLQGSKSGLMQLFERWYPPLSQSPLKALALVLSDAYFPTNVSPNLTHLCLSFPLPRYNWNIQDFTKSLSQMLSNAPRVQFLRLSNLRTNIISVEDFTRRLPKVSLDQLHLLEFSNVQLQMVFYLLRQFTIPEAVLLSIEEDGQGTGVRSNDHPLLLHLPRIAPLNAATFLEIFAQPQGLLLTGYGSTRESGFLLKARNISGVLWSTEWLPELHGMMSLYHITVLHINDNGGKALPSLLPYFTQLEELSILCQGTVHGGQAGVVETISNVFVSLTPLTTLVCPALRFLGLEADIDPTSFPYAELHTMAVERYQWGCVIHRFVYQWHRSTTSRAAAGTSTDSAAEAEPEDKDVLQHIEGFLTSILEPYVDSIEYRPSSAEKLCPFHPPGSWRVPGREKYWSSSMPSYDIPSS